MQAAQRLTDTWCGPIGSAGLAVVIAFMSQDPTLADSDEECKIWAMSYLEHLCFLYAESDSEDLKARKTNFIEFMAYLIDRILRAFSGALLSSRLLQHTLTRLQGGKKSQELMILTRMSPALMAHSHWLLLQYDFIF